MEAVRPEDIEFAGATVFVKGEDKGFRFMESQGVIVIFDPKMMTRPTTENIMGKCQTTAKMSLIAWMGKYHA